MDQQLSLVLPPVRGGTNPVQSLDIVVPSSRPGTSTWPLVVTWAMDIITDPDLTFSGSKGRDFTMAPGSCVGRSHQAVPLHPRVSSPLSSRCSSCSSALSLPSPHPTSAHRGSSCCKQDLQVSSSCPLYVVVGGGSQCLQAFVQPKASKGNKSLAKIGQYSKTNSTQRRAVS